MIFLNSGRNRVVYRSVWGRKTFPGIEVEPNLEENTSSYKFVGNPDNASSIIKDFYKIENEKLFDCQYKIAISGNGNEKEKILTLHSSSRLALLTFYNVSEDNPLVLELNGRPVEFSFSTFEFKNPVIGYPSNMDVVLVSTDRKTVLFLESKFSEYYISAGTKSSPISVQYAENKYSKYFFDKEWLGSVGINMNFDSEDKTQKEFVLSTIDNQLNYLDGFKQMISHYIGIRRRIVEPEKRITSDKNSDENIKIAEVILSAIADKECKIFLGEIVYDKFSLPDGNENEVDPQKVLRDYGRLYSCLAERMNRQIAIDKLENRLFVLEEELKYSKILNIANIEPMTADFYK